MFFRKEGSAQNKCIRGHFSGTLILFLCAVYLLPGAADAGLRVRLGLSGGPSISNRFSGQWIIRYSGQIQYKENFRSYFIRLKGRLTPEFYLNSGENSIIKFSGTVTAGSNRSQTGWAVSLSSRKYFYRSTEFRDFSMEQFLLKTEMWRPKTPRSLWIGSMTYWSRASYSRPGARLQALLLSVGLRSFVNQNQMLSFSLQLERFMTAALYSDQTSDQNRGWRAGPVMAFNVIYPFILNGRLYVLGHYSQLSGKTSGVYGMDLVLGNVFKQKWSLFMLARFQKLHRLPAEFPSYLAYAPTEMENWLVCKLGYDLSASWEVFLRAGWMREELPEPDGPLINTHVLIGFHWTGV